jgi:hypothetical protein
MENSEDHETPRGNNVPMGCMIKNVIELPSSHPARTLAKIAVLAREPGNLEKNASSKFEK